MTDDMGVDRDVTLCPIARRTVLTGAGAAGLLALLAACGDEPDPNPGAAGGSPTPDAPTEEPTGADPTEESTEGDPPENALVAVDEVPVGGGVLASGDIMVVQPRSGVFRAYDAHCPHQATIIDPPDSAGVITCYGHFSRFRASDGSRIDGPATRGLRQVEVRVTRGYVIRT